MSLVNSLKNNEGLGKVNKKFSKVRIAAVFMQSCFIERFSKDFNEIYRSSGY